MIKTRFFQHLDAKAFLGFDVWDFSLRSLARPYGWFFLAAILLRHPLRSWQGIQLYRRQICPRRSGEGVLVGIESRESLRNELAEGEWLVGMGFCEKPLQPACPAGRFNHQCWLLNQPSYETYPLACRACHIREVALRALKAGAALHLMTSAMDIAHDLFNPALRGRRWRVVMSICPFSIPPMSLALAICGCRSLIFGYERGDCRDFTAWDQADRGLKPEQTFLASRTLNQLDTFLDSVATLRTAHEQKVPNRYHLAGNIYLPG